MPVMARCPCANQIVTAMTSAQLRAALKGLRLSRRQCAKRLRVNVRTVYRWASGESEVPETVALLMDCWLRERRRP